MLEGSRSTIARVPATLVVHRVTAGRGRPKRPVSLFEFVTVMVSMILALCLGQVLRSASFLAKTAREVRFHVPFVLWSIVVLITVVNHWWSLWDLRGIEWSYASFLYILAAPILITFATGLLSPSQAGPGTVDLRAHYERSRKLFAVAFMLYAVFMWFDGPLFAGQAVFGKVGMMHVPIIGAALVPVLSGNDRANSLAASVVILVLLVVMAIRYSSA